MSPTIHQEFKGESVAAAMTNLASYKIPNIKDIEYDSSDMKALPNLQDHFPMLKDLSEPRIVEDAGSLQKVIDRVQDICHIY